MRYSGPDDPRLPPAILKRPKSARRLFVETFNGSMGVALSVSEALTRAFLAAQTPMVRCALQRKADIKVIKRNPDGSGVVRIPVLRTGALDLADDQGPIQVTRDLLREAVANFRDYPGPVPIGVSPHRPFLERSGPSPGFVESLTVDGDHLVADLWLVAGLFAEVESGVWRGFSVEFFDQGLSLPSKRMEGAVLVGGVFTNRPAAHVHFAPAFGKAAEALAVALELGPVSRVKETPMSKTAEELQAELDSATEQIRQLEAKAKEARSGKSDSEEQLKSASADAARAKATERRLEAEKAEAEEALAESKARLEGAEKRQKELEAKVDKLTVNETSREVRLIVEEAIDSGVAPAIFEGYDENTAKWLEGSYGSAENLKAVIAKLPKEGPHGKHRKAQRSDTDEFQADVGLNKEHADTLRSLGLNPAYAKAGDENQFRELQARFGSPRKQADA